MSKFYRNARGQGTIFVAIGLLIILMIIFMVFLLSYTGGIKEVKKSLGFGNIVDTTREYASSCLKDALKEGIKKVSARGGYYEIPDDKIIRGDFGETSYAYYDENVFMSREEMGKEIFSYIHDNLNRFCDIGKLNRISTEAGEISGNVFVGDLNVKLDAEWPIEIFRGEVTGNIKEIRVDVDARLGVIHDNVNKLINDLGRSNMELNEGISVKIIEYDDYDVYIITDMNSLIEKMPLRFIFGVNK